MPGVRQVRPILPLWAAVLVAVAAGFILDLAYPSVGWWPLAFLGVGLSLVALVGRSLWGSALVGFVFGITFYLIHIVWLNRYLGVIPWFALAGAATIYVTLGSVLITLAYRWMPRAWPGRWPQLIATPLLIAALWTLREFVTGSWPYSGFPWARVAMSQSESPLAHLTSWVGISGLSFLMVAFTAMLIEWLRARGWRDLRTAAPFAALGVILLLVPQFPTTPAGTFTVGSVQGNGPSGYFDPRARNDVLNAQVLASSELFGDEMDLMLWPEGGIDSDPTANSTTAQVLDAVSDAAGAPLLVNAATERDGLIFNTSMLWIGGEGVQQYHDKAHPVPFGEYVPDRWFYELLVPDLVGLIQREYAPGTNQPYVEVDGVGIGLAICFDVIYDDVIEAGARDGAQVYMFQTNNADFRGTDENLQQLAFARMRAIETGRSVVNISTVGTSQVIAPDGTTIDALPADTAGAMLTEVPLRTGLTPAMLVGTVITNVIVLAGLVGLIAAGIFARATSRRDEAPASGGEVGASSG
ncbi:apolipoprotein N-acyltransferase [Microbacterium sediminicola]|uniref:apolipoprotein N-acyltransferase n=1 Tax=Microbacterium sediminicola TaxID=415210 RepID=UPI0031E179A9